MTNPLAILIVEDSESDAELIVRLLKKAGYEVVCTRVETPEQMLSALEERTWDIVLSDYNLPQFSGRAALELLKDRHSDIPFIVISGAIGEESAVALMKAGAHDYLMKGHLVRLVPAVERELEQAKDRREREQAERALRESEERYRRLFTDAAIGVFHSSFENHFINVNPALARMLGYDSPQEVMDSIHSISDQVYFDPTQRAQIIKQALSKKNVIFTEAPLRRRDGSIWIANITTRPIMDASGRPLNLEGFIEDITERRNAEEQLRLSEQQFRNYFELGIVGMAITSPEKGWLQYNDRLCEMLGYTREELKDLTWIQMTHPDDLDSDLAYFNRVQAGEIDGYSLDKRFIRKDGSVIYVELSVHCLRHPNGEIEHFAALLQDITERKQAEEALRESEFFNQTLLSNSPIGISVRSREGKLLSANQSWKKIWAVPEPDLREDFTRDRQALNFDEHDDYLGLYKDDVRRIYEQGGHLYLPELKILHPRPGGAEWISHHFYAIQNAGGEVVRVVILTEDITERKLAHDIVLESEERLAAVMEGSQLGYSDWNLQTGEIRRNERWAEMLGYTLKEIETTYTQWEDMIHPDDRESALRSVQDHLNGKTSIHRDEYRLRAKDGSYRWVLDQGKVVQYDPQGRPLRMTATHTDVTERKQAEDQLRQLSRAVEYSPASIIITDMNGKIEYVNPKFTVLNGYTLDEVRGKTPRILKSNKMPPDIYPRLWQTILSGQEWRGDLLNRKKNGELYWENILISAITDSKGNITHFVAVNEDITARKEIEERIRLLNIELEQQALTDYLTNLYNRRYFMLRGMEEFKRVDRTGLPMALLMMDIDEFKHVNDSYGHETGDMVLRQIAAVLKSSLRATDVLGRMGGEEFAVLLPDTPLSDAALLAERIRISVANTSLETSDHSLTISITICVGIAAYELEMGNIDDLLRNADRALYYAKNNGRNRIMIYKENLDTPFISSTDLENR